MGRSRLARVTVHVVSMSGPHDADHHDAVGAAEADDLRRAVQDLQWYHSIDLGGGIITPGKNTAANVARIGLPADLSHRTVLDIGAWDGSWSFEAERRGASKVLATDSFVWSDPRWGNRGFELAHRALGSQVHAQQIDVMDLSPAAVGVWDVVLFLGVLYHLKDPISAIERVASVTGDQLILETETALGLCRHPAALLFPSDELANDSTNWWALNDRAVEGLLRNAGFQRVRRYSRTSNLRRLNRAQLHPRREDTAGRLGTALRCRRSVYHAWKS